MNTKRMLLLIVICTLAIACVLVMNYKYDPLSRYPYDTKENRRLIIDHLDDTEIEYIIENNVLPGSFIRFIEAEDFDIYHWFNYVTIANADLGISDEDIVYFAEEGTYKIEVIIKILSSFSAKELKTYLVEWDDYNPESVLVKDAGSLNAIVNQDRTLSVFVPKDLVEVVDFPMTKNQNSIQVRRLMQESLTELCNASHDEANINLKCGGLLIENGFVSYQDQVLIYEDALKLYNENDVLKYTDMPGHSEHQLGLALDFQVSGVKQSAYSKSNQAKWLEENAYRFGFVQSYPSDVIELTNKYNQSNHYRYVGKEMAAELYQSKRLLSEVIQP